MDNCEPVAPENKPPMRLRQAVALPVYSVALIMDYSAAALGKIAGDDWPG